VILYSMFNFSFFTMEEKIVLTWTEKESEETARMGAMYCFKSCDVNRN